MSFRGKLVIVILWTFILVFSIGNLVVRSEIVLILRYCSQRNRYVIWKSKLYWNLLLLRWWTHVQEKGRYRVQRLVDKFNVLGAMFYMLRTSIVSESCIDTRGICYKDPLTVIPPNNRQRRSRKIHVLIRPVDVQ